MNKIIEERKEQRRHATTSGSGTSHKWVLGACWSRKVACQKLRSSRTSPRIFSEVAKLIGHGAITIAQRPKTKRGFTPFCKGLGIYCNGFWGCRDLDPHKCNWKWPKSLYKRSRDSRGKDIDACLVFCPAYLIGKCIDLERERVLWPFCAQRLWREEKRRKRETAKKCVVGTLYTLYWI